MIRDLILIRIVDNGNRNDNYNDYEHDRKLVIMITMIIIAATTVMMVIMIAIMITKLLIIMIKELSMI